jgi:RNA polymerase sigma factor (sigma-70 family)
MDPRELLVEQWSTVQRVIDFTCRRYRLCDDESEELASWVKVKLFEDDCAIVRQFRGDCKLSSYLGVIVQRTVADLWVKKYGKWHSSAVATRMGSAAVDLERMIWRDNVVPTEAITRVAEMHPDVSRHDLETMLVQLPRRERRRETVPLDEVAELLPATEAADVLVVTHERRHLSEEAARVVRKFLAALEDRDRLMLQMHFESNLQLSQIARMLHVEQKPLYRRREQLLQVLKQELEKRGITADEVADLIGHLPEDVDFGLRDGLTEGFPAGNEGDTEGQR